MNIHELDSFLLIGSAVLLAAILAVRLAVGIGFPSLLVYLGIGVALGSSMIGIPFSDADLAHSLGFAALILILTEGGMTTKWSQMKPTMGLGVLLATVGVVVSVAVMAVAAHYVLDLPWQFAILLAAVMSPTDAAAVFSVLRRVPVKRSVMGTLETESGFNDAPIVLIVAAVSAGTAQDHSPLVFALIIAVELLAGGVVGFVVGYLGALSMRGIALPASGLYPIAALAFATLAYAGTAVLHGSGFAAVYVAALVLGNADLPHRAATRSFAEGVGWIAQIGLFVMLGLLAAPGTIEVWQVSAAVIAGAMLTFVARPISVYVCAVWSRTPWREQVFLAWGGLRGAVPIVLTTIPLAEGVSHAADLFNIVFVFVIIYTLVQAPSLPWSARVLGLTTGVAQDVDVEAAPLERVSADLLQVHVPDESRLIGVEVGELRLPAGSSVALIVRSGEPWVPHRATRIQTGDDLLVVAPRSVRERTESRLRAVARQGRLAGWYGDDTSEG